jgi:hypothetical protein
MKPALTSIIKPTSLGNAMNETKLHTNQPPQPGSPNLVSRRHFLQTAAALSSLAGVTTSAVAADDAGKDKTRTPLNQPLGQDYVVVTQVPDENHFIHDPGMTILPNGHLIVAAPVWGRKNKNRAIFVSRSKDGGKTWTKVCEKPWSEATLYVHEGRLYMFTQIQIFEGVWVSASDDEGTSWTEPVEVIKADPARKHWSIQLGMVVQDGWLYWGNGRAFEDMGAVACELKKGLLNPEAWIASEAVVMPIPKEITSGTFTDGSPMRCLEGNVVNVGGRLLVIARAVINRYATANMAAVFDVTREGRTLALTFRQLYPVPGGQCKFHIVWDERSQLFWMASNYPTNSLGLYHDPELKLPPGKPEWQSLREDRRLLMLSYSLDALNWFPACSIAKAGKMTQSFMYPSMVIDGDDIALLSRTGRDSGDYHDADLATFHRVRNFRSLAMDIRPKL